MTIFITSLVLRLLLPHPCVHTAEERRPHFTHDDQAATERLLAHAVDQLGMGSDFHKLLHIVATRESSLQPGLVHRLDLDASAAAFRKTRAPPPRPSPPAPLPRTPTSPSPSPRGGRRPDDASSPRSATRGSEAASEPRNAEDRPSEKGRSSGPASCSSSGGEHHDVLVVGQRIIAATERLRGVHIENRPAIDLMRAYRGPDVLIYLDPPYPAETSQGTREALYRHEMMTPEEHIELLGEALLHPGPMLVSSYRNDVYDALLLDAGWTVAERAARGEHGVERVEALYLNRIAHAEQARVWQLELLGAPR